MKLEEGRFDKKWNELRRSKGETVRDMMNNQGEYSHWITSKNCDRWNFEY
jgi:hypothetical protein